MKRIRLKRKPSFYEDLRFSQWLTDDKILEVVLDRKNRVEEISMDAARYRHIVSELKSLHYI